MHPRRYFLLLLLFSPLTLSVAGCNEEAATAKPPEPPKVTVSKPLVREGEIDTREYNGWLRAREAVHVRSQVRGFVKTIHFKNPPQGKPAEGEFVKAGTPLFDLDPEPFKDALRKAEERVNVFVAQKNAAEKKLAREKELLQKGGSSQAVVDEVEAAAKSLDAQIKAAETDVSISRRDLEQYSKVTAPIDGRIGKSNVDIGTLVTSETVLATINSIDPILVEFTADEPTVQRYRKGGLEKVKEGSLPQVKDLQIKFHFKLDTDPEYTREGRIVFVDNQTDSKTGTILIRGEADNKNRLLMPGDHVRARIILSEPYSPLVVPDTAVNSDQDKKYLLVINDKNIVERRDVRLGKLTDDGLRVVETNLKPEDRVIIEGQQRARIGSPVTPVEKKATEKKQADEKKQS
jgi:RND family efflux transporter MFP subunit